MDELAYALRMDPLELRLRNYADVDPHSGQPFTEKHLRECYQKAAGRFGWSKRSREPRSMRRGHELIGWGMATETYPGKNMPASALVRFQPDGRILVASGTQEIGTGNHTVLTQIAADVLHVPAAMIDARLGDTELPPAPISAGSMSTASVDPAVKAAAESARQKIIALAVADQESALHGSRQEDIGFENGRVALKSNPAWKELAAVRRLLNLQKRQFEEQVSARKLLPTLAVELRKTRHRSGIGLLRPMGSRRSQPAWDKRFATAEKPWRLRATVAAPRTTTSGANA